MHEEQVRVLLAKRFGVSSEKLPDGQLGLFNEAEATAAEAPESDSGTARADQYYRELEQRRLNPVHHVRKIVALSEIYGAEATARALDDAFHFGAFSSDYITNLLEARARSLPEPSALHLTRRADLLELELPKPDLSLYDLTGGPRDDTP